MNISIKNKDYTLDIEAAKDAGVLTPVVTHSIGNVYRIFRPGEKNKNTHLFWFP